MFHVANKKRGVTLVEVLVVFGIIGLLMALLLPALQISREAARRMQCMNNLKQIGLGIHLYENVHTMLPPGQYRRVPGGDTWSWCTQVLPFVEQKALFAQIDDRQAIDAPHNLGALGVPGPVAIPIAIFLCPSRATIHAGRQEDRLANLVKDAHMNGVAVIDYMVISGPHKDALNQDGNPFGKNKGLFLSLDDDPEDLLPSPPIRLLPSCIEDGTSNTLMITENTGRGWGKGIKGAWPAGANIGSVGGENCKELLQPNDPESETRDVACPCVINMPSEVAWPSEEPFSDHPGGVNALMADGSVRFLQESMSRDDLQDMATRDGD